MKKWRGAAAGCPPSPHVPPATCGPDSLRNRSYTMPPRWPLDTFQLIMESASGGEGSSNRSQTCNLYRNSRPCCDLQEWPEVVVEPPVRESIISFLAGCALRPKHRPPCRAADLGANNGWMSMIMLALGAHVVSVEPASDFAMAVSESAHLNCFADRSVVLNAFACAVPDHGPRSCMRSRRAWTGYRAGGPPIGLRDRLKETHGVLLELILTRNLAALPRTRNALTGVLEPLTTIPADALPLHNLMAPPHWDLIKMDSDGPEGSWLRLVERLISQRKLTVGTLTIEGNNVDGETMQLFQAAHGYAVYRLEMGDRRRWITSDGWDAHSPSGTMATLRPPQPRDTLETEVFSLRAMRHLFRVADNITLSGWRTLLGPIAGLKGASRAGRRIASTGDKAVHHWLLTSEKNLAEPTRPGAKHHFV